MELGPHMEAITLSGRGKIKLTFFLSISFVQGSQILEDSWWWQLENSGIYTTKSTNAYLVDSVEESQISPLFKVL